MMQFQENDRIDGRTDERMEGWTEGQKNDRRTDRPYSIGPFQLPTTRGPKIF